MLHEALTAAEIAAGARGQPGRRGHAVAEPLRRGRGSRRRSRPSSTLFVVEDHAPVGALGDALRRELAAAGDGLRRRGLARVRHAGRGAALPRARRRLARRPHRRGSSLKVAVLTTSYPRDASDPAGVFIRDAVEDLRARGVEVEVVSPATFRHFGIAYGAGIAGNLRRSPGKALLLPAFLAEYARAARRAASDADLVHAHWLPSGLPARATGKPYLLTMHGTDAELARRAPALFRPVVRAARMVLCVSESLTETARELGAREVRVVPVGIDVPDATVEPDDPPHVLFVGRLSEEKGVLELVEAARGLPLVVVGDGPLRDACPRRARVRAAGRARRLLRPRGGRRLPVAPRGLRRRRPRGDGARAAGRRDGGRRPRRGDRRRRVAGCSSRPATSRRCAPRSSGCSATPSCEPVSARAGASVSRSGTHGRWPPRPRSRRTSRCSRPSERSARATETDGRQRSRSTATYRTGRLRAASESMQVAPRVLQTSLAPRVAGRNGCDPVRA